MYYMCHFNKPVYKVKWKSKYGLHKGQINNVVSSIEYSISMVELATILCYAVMWLQLKRNNWLDVNQRSDTVEQQGVSLFCHLAHSYATLVLDLDCQQ